MHTHFISLEEVKPEGKAKKEFERFLKSERFMTIDDVLCRALVVTVGSWPLEEYEGAPQNWNYLLEGGPLVVQASSSR